ATDVFSLGATLLFAATGDGPYGQGDPNLLMVRAASGKVERVPRTVPASLRKLLELMLDPRPERRPTAATLAGDGRESAAARALAAHAARTAARPGGGGPAGGGDARGGGARGPGGPGPRARRARPDPPHLGHRRRGRGRRAADRSGTGGVGVAGRGGGRERRG